jgi:autotransporter-associated beta strand protein
MMSCIGMRYQWSWIGVMVICATVGATAVDRDFDGPPGGDWNTATNWVPGGVPGSGDNVFVLVTNGAAKSISLTNTPTPSVVNQVVLAQQGDGIATVKHRGGGLTVHSGFNLGQGGGAAGEGGTGVWNMSGDAVLNVTHSAGGQTAVGVGFADVPSGFNTGTLTITDSAQFLQATNEIRVAGEAAGNRANGSIDVGGSGILSNGYNTIVGVCASGEALVSLRSNASLWANWIQLGNGADSVGALYNRDSASLNVTGPANVGYFPLGNAANAFGYYLHDSTVPVTLQEVGVGGVNGGNGVLEVASGTLTVSPWLTICRGNPAGGQSGMVLVQGGTLRTQNGTQFQHGWGGNGNQYCLIDVGSGGTINGLGAASALNLNRVNAASNTGLLSVHGGGVVELSNIYADSVNPLSIASFANGTFKAKAAADVFGANLDGIYLHDGGLTVDTAGFSFAIDDALLAPTGNGVQSVAVSVQGADYVGRPIVRIEGGGGVGATAVAEWNDATGEIDNITVTSPGSGYTSSPTVTLVGGGGTGATVGAVALGVAVSGGLTKTGGGTLTLTGANTFTGETVVAEGTLSIDDDQRLREGGTIRIAAGATLNLDFTGDALLVDALYLDGVSQPDGLYSAVTSAPYISGTGAIRVGVIPGAAMKVLHGALFINDGDSDALDAVITNTPSIRTYAITNLAAASSNLYLTDTPVVVFSESGGTSYNGFSVSTNVPLTAAGTNVAAGEFSSFTVQFATNALGSYTATVSIANSDTNNNPYEFEVTAAAVPPPELLHRWSFSGDLADSIGDSDATIVEVGPNDATVSATQVTLAGGAKGASDFVRLGNSLLSGRSEAVALELWGTQLTVQNWARIFDFGFDTGEYIMMSWTWQSNFDRDRVSWKDDGGAESMLDDSNAPYTLGTEHHIVMAIEPGAGTGGTTRLTWYSAPASDADLGNAKGTLDTAYTMVGLNDAEDNLGRSFYVGDNTANASYNEVRIWTGSMTPGTLEELHDLGPDDAGVVLPPAPAMRVWHGSGAVVNGGTDPWSPVTVNTVSTRSYVITNLASAGEGLYLTHTPVVVLGENGDTSYNGFTIVTNVPLTSAGTNLAAGAFTGFTVQFVNNVEGSHVATVRIANSDAIKNPYEFQVSVDCTPPPPQPGDLIHRWSFNGDLTDSVGDSDATIIDVGVNNATLSPTQVTLQGGDKGVSDFVRLGSLLLYGQTNAITLEFWATQITPQSWSRIFDFGANDGEYLTMSWTRQTFLAQDRVSWRNDGAAENQVSDSNAPYTPGVEHHIAMTIEPGAGAGGSTKVTWYSAPASDAGLGVPKGTMDVAATLVGLSDVEDNLGRSFYGDATANARYNEARIWLGAKSTSELDTYHELGPDELSLETGTLLIVR